MQYGGGRSTIERLDDVERQRIKVVVEFNRCHLSCSQFQRMNIVKCLISGGWNKRATLSGVAFHLFVGHQPMSDMKETSTTPCRPQQEELKTLWVAQIPTFMHIQLFRWPGSVKHCWKHPALVWKRCPNADYFLHTKSSRPNAETINNFFFIIFFFFQSREPISCNQWAGPRRVPTARSRWAEEEAE